MFTAFARTAALAVLVLTLPACRTAQKVPTADAPASTSAPAPSTVTREPSVPPATPSSPAAGTGSGKPDKGGAILAGKRQVVIAPVGSAESVLTVDDKGRLSLTDGPSDRTLFVLVPVGDGKHQIRTAKADESGEPACMGLRDGSVVAAACDAGRAGQRFTLESEPQRGGKAAYTIGAKGGLRLSVDRSGLVATPGRGTPFTLVDNGAAPAGPGD
ncbi:hypothetical protein [Nucisporomicrobium flavum]|uniref:hypothetical protein n=1 Tax=Nucisporomicrobium flavum TaxID=2785915 RepID=UPI0018F2C90F|nr:hypothetical protein [Nucisporomicrobium flavum]